MESSPRTAAIIVNDLEQRLKNLHTTRVHDDQTLNDLESFLNECSNYLNRLISSSDPSFIAIILPSLLNTMIILTKMCAEKSDTIIPGPFLSRDKHTSLITNIKTLNNQIREFMKLPKLPPIITKSTLRRHFCEQLHLVIDLIAKTDPFTTLLSYKLLVKVLTGADDQQQSQQVSYTKIEDDNDGLTVAVYEGLLQQIAISCARNFRENGDHKEGQSLKVNFH
jgi:hypothetical protein